MSNPSELRFFKPVPVGWNVSDHRIQLHRKDNKFGRSNPDAFGSVRYPIRDQSPVQREEYSVERTSSVSARQNAEQNVIEVKRGAQTDGVKGAPGVDESRRVDNQVTQPGQEEQHRRGRGVVAEAIG